MGCARQVLRHRPSTKVWIRRDPCGPWPLGISNKQCFLIWHCCCDLFDLLQYSSISYLRISQMMMMAIILILFQHICTSLKARWVWYGLVLLSIGLTTLPSTPQWLSSYNVPTVKSWSAGIAQMAFTCWHRGWRELRLEYNWPFDCKNSEINFISFKITKQLQHEWSVWTG